MINRSLLILCVLCSGTFSLADNTNVVPIVKPGKGNSSLVVASKPGDYNFNSFDRSLLGSQVLNLIDKRQETDLKYIENLMNEIDQLGQNILATHINGEAVELGQVKTVDGETKNLRTVEGLNALWIRSQTQNSISLEEYLKSTQAYIAAKKKMELKIKGLLVLPSAMGNDPSKITDDVLLDEKKLTQIRFPYASVKAGIINIQNFYNEQVQGWDAALDSLSFKVSLPDNAGLKVVKGINAFRDQTIFTAAERAKLIKLRNDNFNQSETHDAQLAYIAYAGFVRDNLKASMKTFGSSQDYRLQLNEEGRDRNLDNLEEIWWGRSYLRAVYGIRLGALAIEYVKSKFNWDFFASPNTIPFINTVFRSQAQLTGLQDAAVNAMVTSQLRSKEILKWNGNLLGNVMSLWTWVRGQSQRAKINAVILTYLVADIEEDLLLVNGSGFEDMRAHYQKRWYSSKTEQDRIKKRERAYYGDDSDTSSRRSTDLTTNLGAFLFMDSKLSEIDGYYEQGRQAELQLQAMDANNGQVQRSKRLRNIPGTQGEDKKE